MELLAFSIYPSSNVILEAITLGWQSWVCKGKDALPLLTTVYGRGLDTWDTATVYSRSVS